MGATVIVVDTNQIRDSPMFRSRDWDYLLSKADDWQLRIAVPEVCYREAISVVARKWAEKRDKIRKLHINDVLDEQKILDEIDNKIERYEDALKARLDEIGAEIVPIPESVGMLDVVQRAVDRRAPYSEGQKDGFRDTLIWHTTLSIAAGDSDCEVWLVSANHNDFGEKTDDLDQEACPFPLHPHLTGELEAEELSDRLSYVRTLGRLKQHLEGTYDGLPPEDRKALIEGLNGDEFEALLWDGVMGLMLNNVTAALPLNTVSGIIDWSTSAPDTREFVDAAMRGGGVWTAQFNEKIYATVALLDDDGNTSSIDKTLNVAGRLEAGTDGSVKDFIVTSVEALHDDPMRRLWQKIGINNAYNPLYLRSIQPPDWRPNMQEYLKSIQPPDWRPNMQEFLKSIQPEPGPNMQEFLKSIQPPDWRPRIQEFMKSIQPDLGKINPQEFLKRYYDSLPKPEEFMKSLLENMPKPPGSASESPEGQGSEQDATDGPTDEKSTGKPDNASDSANDPIDPDEKNGPSSDQS